MDKKEHENDPKSLLHKGQVIGETALALGGRPVMVRDVRTAKRLLGKIIVQIQRGEILTETARLLTYCLSTYVGICKDSDYEARLSLIEEVLKKKSIDKI